MSHRVEVADIGNTVNINLSNVKLDWSVYTCLTQRCDGRDKYRIYYIKNNYMFRHFTLAIFRLINEKNVVSGYTRLACNVYGGEVRSEMLCRMGNVGTWVLILYAKSRLAFRHHASYI